MDRRSHQPFPSRGALDNPANRYERMHIAFDDSDEDASAETVFYRDASRTVLAENDSPDINFRFSLNPYRGCEHGCIYCYARPTHEYLSFSAGLDFERRILVKHDAPELLRAALQAARWQPQIIALSGNTDCYQPVERHLRLTRRCLEVLCEFRNPVGVVTKSALVARDVDLLAQLAAYGAAQVCVSVTSLDFELARRMEPRAARPERRLEAIRILTAGGVPVSVLVAPVIPGLNDEEIPRILAAAAAAGAKSAGYVLLRLPTPVDALFTEWLNQHYPQRRERILGRIRACRDGRLSDPRYGSRQRGEGVYAKQIAALFASAVRRYGLNGPAAPLSAAAFRCPPQAGEQLRLC
ncbi:MAG: PA0069 family radical SAM protein [Deltaproteobacteria bacterium]|nr:PA0069 family radical SAM protein [Deltaproteobacteria bacterium]